MKQTTMTMKGGNTEALYNIKEGEKDGRLLMAESLQQQHPDVTTITRKWGRWQHHVNYKPFRNNKLVLRTDLDLSSGTNNYGMELKMLAEADATEAYETPQEVEEIEEPTTEPELPLVDEGFVEIPAEEDAQKEEATIVDADADLFATLPVRPCYHIPACFPGECPNLRRA